MYKIAIIGNCQAAQIGKIIKATAKDVYLYDLPANYLALDEDRGRFEEAYEEADFVLVQYTPGESVRSFCRHSYARQASRNALVWPNVYFDGYTPDISYFRINRAVVQGPIGGYHSQFIREKFLEGRGLLEITELYQGQAYASSYSGSFERSLNKLRARETECDLHVSGIVGECAQSARVFSTPDHPSNSILQQMVKEFGRAAGIKFAEEIMSVKEIDDLFIPANQHLLHGEGCSFIDGDDFVSKRAEDDFVSFSQSQIVGAFCDLYQSIDRDLLQNGTTD